MGEHLTTILKKMCEHVNTDFDQIDTSQPNWYTLHSWTLEQQMEFRSWLIKYLKNKKAQKELYDTTFLTKERIERLADGFIFNYGWKVI